MGFCIAYDIGIESGCVQCMNVGCIICVESFEAVVWK